MLKKLFQPILLKIKDQFEIYKSESNNMCVFSSIGKPKIEPIIWEASQIRSHTTGPQFRNRPPRRGLPPYQGQNQQRGRGQFQRGRSPVPRSTRGGSRGSRGGMFRSPNMY